MIKLTFCLVRLPSLGREAFQNYWYGTHAPLVASVAETLKIQRYVQMHSLPAEASAGIRESRDAPAEFDGVAELWFESLEALAENGRRPEAQAAAAMLLEDEKRFIDLSRSPLWWGQERVIVG
ncbi:MAG: EthD domain-containing protein [Alphaproteobacteria bacterium]|nr:EthD domain-containing protein [Alphaproteobacteria bacterium]MBU1513148.1 EthD domain-containing protein [Alphaproteobacteria bacterium]MBU2095256.1 EthD domain-containing protein [Alphaproteobacteria bacterium]MBU2152171.1 EthD domain-containing protein [Alphaproteobacteria bacterium]MBU2306782.1 EthD domain-containing protein [Alphaproteobacteria bacterium]